MKGKFIVFEGSDGSGKTTVLDNVRKYLDDRAIDYVLTREPGGTEISEYIRRILLDKANGEMTPMTEALLYAAARAQHVEEFIVPNIEAGRLVISDRYVMSSLAYQAFGRKLDYDIVKNINDYATGKLRADYTIFLNVDPITVLNRKKQTVEADRLEIESESYHERVYKGYQEMIARQNDKSFILIDASRTLKEVTDEVINKLKDIIGG